MKDPKPSFPLLLRQLLRHSVQHWKPLSPNLADRLIGDAQEIGRMLNGLVRALEQSKSEAQGRGPEA